MRNFYIPELRLETLSKLISLFQDPPGMFLASLFGERDFPSNDIYWYSTTGGRSLARFKAPGNKTHVTVPTGYAKSTAAAAFWGEKMFLDEEFLNNLAKLGTAEQYELASSTLSKNMQILFNKVRRRKEWMFAKMMFMNGFSYQEKSGYKCSVDYGIPSTHRVTLAADKKWSTGASRDIIGDIIYGKRTVADACGAKITKAILNSVTLQYVAQDTTLLTLLAKSQFGNGDLFTGAKNNIVGVNPNVLGSLLDIPNIVIYDDLYEITAGLTAVVTANSTTTVSVSDTADFEVGTARFRNVLTDATEEVTITAVNTEAGTVTIATAPTASYKAGQDEFSQRLKFCPDGYFGMFPDAVEGEAIAEYMRTPYGLDRNYGVVPDQNPEWDPDGLWVRVQDKGLPVLYHKDAPFVYKVA